jgi:hypothetical protein
MMSANQHWNCSGQRRGRRTALPSSSRQGGFVALGYTRGGTEIAQALARHGFTAFVLKYRTIRSGDGPMRMPDAHMREMDMVMARAKGGEPVEMPAFAGEPHAIEDGARG